MGWPAIIAGAATIGSALINKSGQKTSGKETTSKNPAPRTAEGQQVWDAYMDELLGKPVYAGGQDIKSDHYYGKMPDGTYRDVGTKKPKAAFSQPQFLPAGEVYGYSYGDEGRGYMNYVPNPNYNPNAEDESGKYILGSDIEPEGREGGAKATLKGQEDWLRPKQDEYRGALTDLMNNQGVGAGLLDKATFTLGGSGGVSFVPKSNQEAVGLLAKLAKERMNTDLRNMPGWGGLSYLNDYLNSVAMKTEGLRYGIPSTSETASLSRSSTPSILSMLSAGLQLGDAIADVDWGKLWG